MISLILQLENFTVTLVLIVWIRSRNQNQNQNHFYIVLNSVFYISWTSLQKVPLISLN